MFRTRRKRKTSLIIVLGFAVILVSARLYLPIWLKGYVNDQIALLGDYGGGIDDVDVFLWRGAYQIDGLNIYKKIGGLEKPFVAAETVDLSVEWAALFNGAVVAEIDIYAADLNFSKSQTGRGAGWTEFVDALSPLDINRLDVHSGRLTYTDYAAKPNVHLFIDEIDAKITNLRQVKNKETPLPSRVKISGTSIGGGVLILNGEINILKGIPDFDLALELKNASLTAFNDYARNFAAIDFESGTLGLFAELAAVNGRVTGYVKPVATDVSLVSIEQDGNPFNAIWESLASLFIEIFENQSEDQFAMRIPIEGDLNDPDKDMWSGFFSIFDNAFGGAFSKTEDGTINFEDALEQN
jgi:hypothetical protein